MGILFRKKFLYGTEIYDSPNTNRFSVIQLDNKYYIRMRDKDGSWIYPLWAENQFQSFDDAMLWLNIHDWKNATADNISYDDSVFAKTTITPISDRQAILAAINTRNLANNLSRVRSSNIWAYGLNVRNRKDKTGDLIVQFKGENGGAGDIYIYYDVPTTIYRRWQSAPSKGHYFWVYIRNNYNYSKLTGDKRGKLKNAINN